MEAFYGHITHQTIASQAWHGTMGGETLKTSATIICENHAMGHRL